MTQEITHSSAPYYDNFTEYDTIISKYYSENTAIPNLIRELVGPGTGECMDLGCGSGINSPLLKSLGYEVTGVDISAKQLAVAQKMHRLHEVVQADAEDLPFADNSFSTIMSCYTHTDFEDWDAVAREVHRTLRPGGRFVYVGPHPCFFGGMAKKQADGALVIYNGYYNNDNRIFEAPGFSSGGVRQTIGEKHLSLERLIGGVLASGLQLEALRETKDQDPPATLGFCAIKSIEL